MGNFLITQTQSEDAAVVAVAVEPVRTRGTEEPAVRDGATVLLTRPNGER